MKIIQWEDTCYPESLKEIESPPSTLYCLGNTKLLNSPNLAIVGSRKASEYGKRQAYQFAQVLAKSGMTIVSGMALGIDTQAHLGALKVKQKTIAVLGSGFHHIYPPENETLFCEILEKDGLILSEYEPNQMVKSSHFPARNRIISGLSKGVLVVEAAYRSGSSITAQYAKQQKRKLYAIPSNIGNKNGVGTARLIRQGAKIVISPQDILEDFDDLCKNNPIKWSREKKEPINPIPRKRNVPEAYQTIYQLLEKENNTLDGLAMRLELSVSEISATLILMEIEGYIQKKRQGEYQIQDGS